MIRYENVSKVFPNGYVGLQNVSFAIEPQSLTYIVGESGAGKTTLMRLLIREMLPSEGEIFFQDQPISQIKAAQIPYLRRQVGVIFQDYKLIPERNVAENIALVLEILGIPGRQIKQQVIEVMELVGLADKLSLFPVQLSGGELQRVAIARALAMTPTVLFADEPTGNLDPTTSQEIGQLLQKITQLGTTVLVSTHDVNLLTNFPARELHLQQGRLIHDTASGEKPAAPAPARQKKKSGHAAVKEKHPDHQQTKEVTT